VCCWVGALVQDLSFIVCVHRVTVLSPLHRGESDDGITSVHYLKRMWWRHMQWQTLMVLGRIHRLLWVRSLVVFHVDMESCMCDSHWAAWAGSRCGSSPCIFLVISTLASGESVFLCYVDTLFSWMWIIQYVNFTFGELVIQGETSLLEYSPKKHTESKA